MRAVACAQKCTHVDKCACLVSRICMCAGWALAVSISRAFGFKQLRGYALAPLIDMANHAPVSNAEVRYSQDSGRISLIANSQVCVCVGGGGTALLCSNHILTEGGGCRPVNTAVSTVAGGGGCRHVHWCVNCGRAPRGDGRCRLRALPDSWQHVLCSAMLCCVSCAMYVNHAYHGQPQAACQHVMCSAACCAVVPAVPCVLCCAVLCCAVLCCAVLCCAVLCCAVL
jgi:hypothetical protein